MHSVFEGLIPIVISCVLRSLYDANVITLDIVNARKNLIYAHLKLEKKNKPPNLNSIPKEKEFTLSPSMSAAQLWSFFRFLPIMLAPYVNAKCQAWTLLLLAEEIVDIIFPFDIADDTLDYFSETYTEFLISFGEAFPGVHITPKLHFLIHFATTVRKNGPPRVYWTMAYERFNGSVKQP